jgi:hypothetical protein
MELINVAFKVIQKAKDACKNAGELIENHFPDVRKMVEARYYADIRTIIEIDML